jgi:hypothetical protein
MWYGVLADVVVGIHLAYVSYVVVGQLLILVGVVLRWQWVRNPWFRWTHLLAIGTVAFEAIFGITCPLTDWEDNLRTLAGKPLTEGETFIGRLMHNTLIFHCGEQWVFTTAYISFALLVLLTFLLAPPRRRRSRAVENQSTPIAAVSSGEYRSGVVH